MRVLRESASIVGINMNPAVTEIGALLLTRCVLRESASIAEGMSGPAVKGIPAMLVIPADLTENATYLRMKKKGCYYSNS